MKKMLILSFLFCLNLVFSQGEANIWYFGQNAGLDFNSGSPVSINGSQMNTLEGCSTISNSSGQLLFYTDGVTVWDRNHNIMPNGTGLMGHESSTQSSLVIPKPNDPNIYYLFTVSEINSDGLRYSVIDMSLNGGVWCNNN